ncbi:ribonuclease H-like domain-containing protein [Tanacetum coccineum]
MPLKPDLVYPSLDDFVYMNESVNVFVVEKPTVNTNEPKTARKENGAPIIEDWMSKSEEDDVPKTKTVEMLNKPSFAKINFVKSTKQIKSPRKTSVDKNRQNTPSLRGNKRKWNQHMSQKLGNDFEMFNNACHVCGSFDHLKNDCNNWYNNRRFAKPVWTNVQKVNTIKGTRVNTSRPKAVLSVVKGTNGNAVKALASWVWRPSTSLDMSPRNNGNPQQELKDKGVFDSGCSRHMTGNRSYLTNYEEIDGGFVAFGDFKLTDESHVLLKVPRKDNMYSVDLKNVVPQGGLTCLFAKATPDESNLWHRRLGHVNFKTMNKLVKGNLVRGIENLIDLRVKVIRCDNGTEFKNRIMNQFYEMKGIKREFSVSRTPQQNGVAKGKNRTLIEAARTMLADLKLPTTFWAKEVNTACYVQNRIPFGCPVTILNIIDHLGKFDGKADEGFFVGYSTNSKAFRVFNSRTMIVEENLHVQFSENKPNIAGSKARMETDSPDVRFKPSGEEEKKDAGDPRNEDSEVPSKEEPRVNQEKDASVNSTNTINIVSPTVNTAGIEDNVVDENIVYECDDDPNMPELEEIIY